MRLLSVFRVTLREQLRSPWDLLLVLLLAPLFLWLYWSFAGGASTYYDVVVIDGDRGACPVGNPRSPCAVQVIDRMAELTYESGTPLLRVHTIDSRAEAEEMLRSRAADALLIFSPEFTASIRANVPSAGSQAVFVGDLSNPYYSPAAILAGGVLDSFVREAAGQPSPIRVTEEALGGSGTRTEFEIYVPGLIISAGTMMLFSVAIAVTRLIESGVVRRLQLTRMTALDLLGGLSVLYVLLSLGAVLLSFLTAEALGFRSAGPMWLAMVICSITGISVVGVGLITACFAGSVARAAVIVNFPLFLLLFFSGAVFPVGNPRLFTLGGRFIGLFDLFPQTHATLALNKVLSLGAGPAEVAFELVALAGLSVIYFAAGVWLFQKMHLRAA